MSELRALQRHLAANRFMPVPPTGLMFCGDGDFRAIGAEFLGRFVEDAALAPGARVLDVGCGIGRMALPLTQYLGDAGGYDGVDPVAAGVEWCRDSITPVYPNFRFHHLDVRHPLYNPDGALDAAATPLPFADASFDLVLMVSVLTHLEAAEVLHYAREVSRLLAPGGRCFATAFLVNPPARDALAAGRGRLGFDPAGEGPVFHADPAAPLAAVAFDEDFFLEKFLRFGLRRRDPARYGHWSGRELPPFQDICVFERG